MKKTLLWVVALGLALSTMAQGPRDDFRKEHNKAKPAAAGETKPEEHKVKIMPYGFVRNYFTYDSRKTYTVIGGEYNMQPLDESWNLTEAQAAASGLERYDMNAVPSTSFLAITTRFGLNLSGPMVLGARSSGKIEADFGGFSTTNSVLRIRHAWVQLDWGQGGKLLMGQHWHPLSGSIMPEVLGMAAGAPFRPHSRTPQINYEWYNGRVGFTAALLSQLQYMCNGPQLNWTKPNAYTYSSAASTSYAYNAVVPEVFLGLNYKSEHVYSQLGVDVLTLRPRTTGVDDATGYRVAVDDKLTTYTPTFYFQYTDNLFAMKFRTLYAQNTSHVNQLNGYAVTDVRADGTWDYAPMRASISYLNFAYGKKYRFNLFLGYMKNFGVDGELYNFGSAEDPQYRIYSKGNYTNIDNLYRVAPSISYNVKAFNFGVEYELTTCTYGDIAADGTIIDNSRRRSVTDHRLCVLIKYNF